jgi:ATP-dependent 26S proteasome regulatory subunit
LLPSKEEGEGEEGGEQKEEDNNNKNRRRRRRTTTTTTTTTKEEEHAKKKKKQELEKDDYTKERASSIRPSIHSFVSLSPPFSSFRVIVNVSPCRRMKVSMICMTGQKAMFPGSQKALFSFYFP